MRWVGVGYRREIAEWISTKPEAMDSVEITAEHFFDDGLPVLEWLRQNYVTFVHGLGLSLGTPGPLDRSTLASFSNVAERADAKWVSEHVSFTRTGEIDLGHLNPVPLTKDSLQVMTEHALEVADYCKRPLVLENITFDLKLGGNFSEPEFLNLLCEKANCKLLLDITNLYINSQNHGFCPEEWLREIEPTNLRQIHVVGYSKVDGFFRDFHGSKIQSELLDLLRVVLDYAAVESIILERDERLEELVEIANEVSVIQGIANG